MNDLDIICSSMFKNVTSYAELMKRVRLEPNLSDPVYNHETNRYDPSAILKCENDSQLCLWLYGGEIVDSMHPCCAAYTPKTILIYYYSSIMKKYNQPQVIRYNVDTKTINYVEQNKGTLSFIWRSGVKTSESRESFIDSIFVREAPPIVFKFAD